MASSTRHDSITPVVETDLRSVSVVVPCHNEKAHIQQSLSSIVSVLRELPLDWSEIVAIDDGSTDSTLSVLKDCAEREPSIRVLRNARNCGKGYSVRKGVLQAVGDLIVFTDADLSIPASEIRRAFDLMSRDNPDVLIGSRAVSGSQSLGVLPLYRKLMGRAFNHLTHTLVGLSDIEDSQCGFKCFSRCAAHALFQRLTVYRYAFDVEILYMARASGMKIQQMPVTCINRVESAVRPLRDSVRTLIDLAAIRARHSGRT